MELSCQTNSFSDKNKAQKDISELMETPEFINNFGAVFKEEMIIHESNRINSIRLKNISKIVFVKNRKYHLEVLSFCLAAILIFSVINYENSFKLNMFLGFMSLLLMFIGDFFQFFQYKLIIVSKQDFVEIKVDKQFKAEAMEMAGHLKSRISMV